MKRLSHLLVLAVSVMPLRAATPAAPIIAPEAPVSVLAQAAGGELLEKGGLKILRLNGTPEEQGRQQGLLQRKEIGYLYDRMLYSMSLAATVRDGRWFFDDIGGTYRHLAPFLRPEWLGEMDALAAASGRPPGEVRLAQVFPEMFHCSGFAVFNSATRDGRLYHGRILDYFNKYGLQDVAVVVANTPAHGYRWINVGYAGFLGSVTAMNEKQLTIGEMGGSGYGQWDGEPMSYLVRDVMEKCATVEEAVDLLKRSPRTCEYYYVISCGRDHHAVGIEATPDKLLVLHPGESNPLLPNPSPDTILMSGDNRYSCLSGRVKKEFGQLGPVEALQLMSRPVAMDSCLHAVLFAPDTLELWVANASPAGAPATTQPYHHLTWQDLFGTPPPSAL
jgi:isopenicillin-N N-acyltransferase-like protein